MFTHHLIRLIETDSFASTFLHFHFIFFDFSAHWCRYSQRFRVNCLVLALHRSFSPTSNCVAFYPTNFELAIWTQNVMLYKCNGACVAERCRRCNERRSIWVESIHLLSDACYFQNHTIYLFNWNCNSYRMMLCAIVVVVCKNYSLPHGHELFTNMHMYFVQTLE